MGSESYDDEDGAEYGEEELSEIDEGGESELDDNMEEMLKLQNPQKKSKKEDKPVSADKADGDGYEFVKDDEDEELNQESGAVKAKKGGKKKKEESKEAEEEEFFDRYRMDPLLVRRESTLLLLCLKAFKKRVIIFFNEKKQCGRLHSLFAFFGLNSVEVHGDLSQEERLGNVEKFQRGEVDYLLATDLVARGLDISAVTAVLNFSFPTEPKRYLHRVGRTARAGSHGQAVTLCNDEERKEIKKLIRKLNQKLLPYTVPHKLIKMAHDYITNTLDPVLREISLEFQ